jgi:hypothetical protein
MIVEKTKKIKETKKIQQSKKIPVSTEVFKDKSIPAFIKEHTLFKKPTQIQKVFPSVGLPNFSDKVKIDKAFENIKKEGSYVFNLLQKMCSILSNARDSANILADKLQYLSSKEERDANRTKINDLYFMSKVLGLLSQNTDPYDGTVLNTAMQMSDGRVVLKLIINIPDEKEGKNIFRKDEPLFRIFNALKDKCATLDIAFTNLETTEQFKTFSKENMPNKEYSVIFSSEGEAGAWDIATMSMRGIKSCQRWDGEYPRCLIGSILSKYVGIIYLTSGVKAEDHPAYTNLGSKMIRRCVVRYAIDADEGAPCILIDKMYPEYDKEVCAIFTKSLQAKTKLPVHYAPELGNKIRHIYVPTEKVRNEVSNREWSYQDTPLKSKEDINVFYLLNNNKEEIERDVRGFKSSFPLFLANKMEDIYSGNIIVDDEIKKTIKNIKMNTAFTPFCYNIFTYMISSFPTTDSKNYKDSKSYYRRYLMDLLMNKKKSFIRVVSTIKPQVQAYTSRTVDMNLFTEFLYSLMVEFVKLEMKKVMN